MDVSSVRDLFFLKAISNLLFLNIADTKTRSLVYQSNNTPRLCVLRIWFSRSDTLSGKTILIIAVPSMPRQWLQSF